MPTTGVNDEPLQDRRIFAYDGTNYRVVKCDTDGNLVIALKAEEDVQANAYGWINAAWQKDPLRLGYSGQLQDVYSNTNLSAGNNLHNFDTVPSGEIWVITALWFMYIGTSPTYAQFYFALASGTHWPLRQPSPTSSQVYSKEGQWVLVEDDIITVSVSGATAGDDLYGGYMGYRVDIDQ